MSKAKEVFSRGSGFQDSQRSMPSLPCSHLGQKHLWYFKCTFSARGVEEQAACQDCKAAPATPKDPRLIILLKTGGLSMALSKTQERDQTEFSNRPQPVSGKMGATIIGPTNPAREAENPDNLVPPRVDHGTMANLRWSFADSHMHLSEG